jgi:hypothetical protein
MLSPDGEWLAFLASSLNSTMPPNRLEVINLNDESTQAVMILNITEAFWPPVWSFNLAQPRLAALAGPVINEREPALPTRLLVASPYQTNEFQVVAEAVGAERFVSPVFCADGALLYLVEADDVYQIRRQMPDRQAQTLATFAQPFYPLACP